MRDVPERFVVFIAKERSGLMTPAAADDVRISEVGVGAEDGPRGFFLIGHQIFTAKNLSCRGANDFSQDGSDLRSVARRLPARRTLSLRRLIREPFAGSGGTGRSGNATVKVDP